MGVLYLGYRGVQFHGVLFLLCDLTSFFDCLPTVEQRIDKHTPREIIIIVIVIIIIINYASPAHERRKEFCAVL